MRVIFLFMIVVLVSSGCVTVDKKGDRGGFRGEVSFLEAVSEIILLSENKEQSRVVVVPEFQGRVATSTSGGENGSAYGWFNRKLLARNEPLKHVNLYGGEDCVRIGPDGGQFSISFSKGSPFDFKHWFVPAAFDRNPFEVVKLDHKKVEMRTEMLLKNYSGAEFKLRLNREVRILSREEALSVLGVKPAGKVDIVAFESRNTITNTGKYPWKKETGLLSVRIQGFFPAGPEVTAVVPVVSGSESDLGPVVNDGYTGKVPEKQMLIKDGVLFFKCDGVHHSRIGVSPYRAKSVVGSYDADKQLLTIVQYNKPGSARDYVNSTWVLQNEPYKGDAISLYNGGSVQGDISGTYRLETSSPAARLGVGGTVTHIHRTIHLHGSEDALDPIARKLLGVSIADIRLAL